MTTKSRPKLVGVGLKMYFSASETILWASEVKNELLKYNKVLNSSVELFVLPSTPMLKEIATIFLGTKIALGSQDHSPYEYGPYTGDVSAGMISEIGCKYAEVGHAERRHLYHEDDNTIAKKTEQAFRNKLIPIVCVGEVKEIDRLASIVEVLRQLNSALLFSRQYLFSPMVVAYEPVWAIGVDLPANADHIVAVCSAIKDELLKLGVTMASVIYGGSAGPKLFSQISDSVDGLFLGRAAHDVKALVKILEEVEGSRNG